jgi:hypothetical protein
MSDVDDLVTWLRAQLNDDERWARAASQAYPYAEGEAAVPDTGVHWTWVVGGNWEPTNPDPVVDEFVAEPGESCNLATVEQWPSQTWGISGIEPPRMPRVYADSIVEMDASAAGHIARWDPARVLAEVDAKRQVIEQAIAADRAYQSERRHGAADPATVAVRAALVSAVASLALPYADRPGYRDEWRP